MRVAVSFFTALLLMASMRPVAADDFAASQTTTSPITVRHCRVTTVLVRMFGIDFTNTSPKTAKSIRFAVYEDGAFQKDFLVTGTFSQNAPIHRVMPIKHAAGIVVTDPAGITCQASYVEFEDGTTWQSSTGTADVAVQPGSPIQITDCTTIDNMPNAADRDFTVAISFVNRSNKVASAVRFRVEGFDAFDDPAGSGQGTVYGHFAPGAIIEPVRNPNTTDYVYTPSSPVWRQFKFSDMASHKCSVEAVRFEDGSIWRGATPQGAATKP